MLVNQNVDTYDRRTDEYIVAYIDLLGMTNRIKTEERQLVMNKLYNLYVFSVKLTKETGIKENQDIQFKIFSDNIIIANGKDCLDEEDGFGYGYRHLPPYFAIKITEITGIGVKISPTKAARRELLSKEIEMINRQQYS